MTHPELASYQWVCNKALVLWGLGLISLPLPEVWPSGRFGNGHPGVPSGQPALSLISLWWDFSGVFLVASAQWVNIDPSQYLPILLQMPPSLSCLADRGYCSGPEVHALSSCLTQMVCGHRFRIVVFEKTRSIISTRAIPKNSLWWWKWFLICAMNMVATSHMWRFKFDWCYWEQTFAFNSHGARGYRIGQFRTLLIL